MAVATGPKKRLLKGFSDYLDGRLVQFLDELPAGVPTCSLCSTVPSEHYRLGCKHVYCRPCFLETVRKNATALRCPVDGKNFRPRKAPSPATTDADLLSGLPVHCWNKDNGCTYSCALEHMTAHYRDCAFYEVTCGYCSNAILRSDLAAHVETVHMKIAKPRAQKKSERHEVAAVCPGGTSVADGTEAAAGESAATGEHSAKQPASLATRTQEEGMQELLKAVASRTASAAAEDVAQWNEALFRGIMSGIKQINERMDTLIQSTRVTFPEEPPAAVTSGAPPMLPLKHQLWKEHTWTVSQYSKIKVGIHYVKSPLFEIASGYKGQFTACIDGIKLVELSVSVKICQGDDEARQLPCPFKETCRFTLADKSGSGSDVTRSFSADELLRCAAASSSTQSNLASGWLNIAKMDRGAFERDYVKDDAFTILFRTDTSPD